MSEGSEKREGWEKERKEGRKEGRRQEEGAQEYKEQHCPVLSGSLVLMWLQTA